MKYKTSPQKTSLIDSQKTPEELLKELNALKGELASAGQRLSNLDAKFCIPRKDPFAKKLESAFAKGKCLSLDEIGEHFINHKLTDIEKKDHIILEFSFLLTNKHRHPILIERGAAHAISRKCSVLQSFTPTMLGPHASVRDIDDFRFFFSTCLRYKKNDYTLRLLGLARNEIKGKVYYFVVIEANFPGQLRVRARPTESTDKMLGHVNLQDPESELYKKMAESLKGMKVDRLALLSAYKSEALPDISDKCTPARIITGDKAETLFKKYDAFISHTSEDADFSRQLADALTSGHALKIWLDALRLDPGNRLDDVIKRGIEASRFGIVIASERFFKKRWTLKEWGYLVREAKRRKRDIILPVWLDVDLINLPKKAKFKKQADYYKELADLLGVKDPKDTSGVAAQLAMRINADRIREREQKRKSTN